MYVTLIFSDAKGGVHYRSHGKAATSPSCVSQKAFFQVPRRLSQDAPWGGGGGGVVGRLVGCGVSRSPPTKRRPTDGT